MRPALLVLAGIVLVLALCRVDDAGATPGHDRMTATAASAATMTADARTATAATPEAPPGATASPTAAAAPSATPSAAVTATAGPAPTPTGTPRRPTRTPRAGPLRVWLPWVG